MRIHFKDELFDAQLLRALDAAYYGGATVGECLATAGCIAENSPNSWYQEWWSTAARLDRTGEDCLVAGHSVSAREAFLRASTYYRIAALFLSGTPADPRILRAAARQSAAFRRAMALGDRPYEPIAIPYEGTTLPGYFCRADSRDEPRPLLIVSSGYDSSAEEMYCFAAAAAVRRGYHCLCFDGPGQGAALIEQGLVFRPDWEAVIGPVVDYALTRPEIDAQRIALIGESFGGYLAPRAASDELRLAALIADPGQFDLFAALQARFPSFLAQQLPEGHGLGGAALDLVLSHVLHHPTRGWALRRGMWTHGAATVQDYLRLTRDYTLRGRAERIACPTLICCAEDDEIAAQSRQLYDALTCPKAFLTFSEAEGAGAHCEQGNRALFHQRAFDWLDATLRVATSA